MLCPGCEHENIAGEDLCSNCGLDLAGLDVGSWGVDPNDPMLSRTLNRIVLKEPLTVSPGTTVAEAISLMKARHEGCVFVTDEAGRLAGLLTERHVVVNVVAPRKDPAETTVGDVMSRDPVTLERSDPLAWALHRMGVDGMRHVAVMEGTRLVGFLSLRTVLDVLRGSPAGSIDP